MGILQFYPIRINLCEQIEVWMKFSSRFKIFRNFLRPQFSAVIFQSEGHSIESHVKIINSGKLEREKKQIVQYSHLILNLKKSRFFHFRKTLILGRLNIAIVITLQREIVLVM